LLGCHAVALQGPGALLSRIEEAAARQQAFIRLLAFLMQDADAHMKHSGAFPLLLQAHHGPQTGFVKPTARFNLGFVLDSDTKVFGS
jgi:hypothetical protein